MDLEFIRECIIKNDLCQSNTRLMKSCKSFEFWKKHPDKFTECILGVKLTLYQRLLIKLFGSNKKYQL